MSDITPFTKEKLVIGLLLGRDAPEAKCLADLERLFGPIDYRSPRIEFTFTGYYDDELGPPITRLFVSFRTLVAPDALADIKIATNGLEARFAADGRRRINLDPGTMALSRFVLASAKPSSHRIPLARGIHAEIELVFEYGVFRPVEWTYADYRSPHYLAVLKEIRDQYRADLQAEAYIRP
jgi:hypothetical protein